MTTTAAPSAPPADVPTSLSYQPSLDGLRGLAVAAIIVYHAGGGHMPGAFLSVSTFFTLSGFLITAVLLSEHARSGVVSLKRFWARRLRRLMPASLAGIALIVGGAMIWADSTQLQRLRGDALASLAYVANWRFILSGDSYGANFESPSPFTHFWSLAIEEQFYVVFPLIVVAGFAVGRGSRKVLAGVFAGCIAVGMAWSLWLQSSDATRDRLYFGTDVRAVELFAGALLAIWWMRSSTPIGETGRRRSATLGTVALGAMLVLWLVADLGNSLVYRGGLAAYSLITCAVIVAAMQPGSPVATVLSFRPLVWLGTLSYGLYIVHYPVLLWLDQETGWNTWVRLAVAVPITIGIAVLSARLLEEPVRRERLITGPRAIWAAPIGVLVVALLVVGATGVRGDGGALDLEEAAERKEDVWEEFLADEAEREASATPKVAVFGDSAALITSIGLVEWGRDHPDELIGGFGWSALGCGLLPEVTRISRGQEVRPAKECPGWLDGWAAESADRPSDIAVIQLGGWDVTDQQLVEDGPYLVIGEDPELDAALEANLRTGIETLLEDNGMVVLLLSPDIDAGRVDGRSPDTPFPESDPARMESFREIQRRVAADTDRVEIVDLKGYLDDSGEDARLRPDGIHFTEETAYEVADWLAPTLREIHEDRTGSSVSLVQTSDS